MRLVARFVVLLPVALASAMLSTAPAQATVPAALMVGQEGLSSYDISSAATTFPTNTRIAAARRSAQSRSLTSRSAPRRATKGAASLVGRSYGNVGEVVENPGIKISGFRGAKDPEHGLNQVINRGVYSWNHYDDFAEVVP